LLRRIGAGSYGEVWLARNVLGTLRAVKVVWRKAFESDRPYDREFAGIQRFEPLSRAHEGLVDILQIGRDDAAGYFYYVMELADDAARGEAPEAASFEQHYQALTLRAEIKRRGRIPVEECLRHFLTLASGLATLHEKGLIHRDIKPSNIILVGGVPKLADIGLVTEAGESLSFVGTEGFIAPEGPGSRQADIYSLGKVLYEAATGNDRLAFPSFPQDLGLGPLAEDLLEVNAVLLRACARDPRERYASVEELRADLSLLLSGRSVKRLRLLERRLRWARQAGAVAGVVAVLAVAGGLAAGYRARLARENADELGRALGRARRAEADAKDHLYRSLAATAVAERRSGQADARFSSLEAIASASEIHPRGPGLRDTAISALALPGLREIRRWPLAPGFNVQCFSGDLEQVFLGDTNGVIHVRKVEGGGDLFTVGKPGDPLTQLTSLGSGGRWAVAVRKSGSSECWDMAEGRLLGSVAAPLDWAISADARWLVGLDPQKKVHWRDLLTGNARELTFKHDYDLICGGPGSDFVLASREDTNVCVVDFATGEPRVEISLPPMQVPYSLQFAPSGDCLLINMSSGRVQVHDLWAPATPRAILEPHNGAVRYARFHPDGDWCLTSSWDDTTQILGVSEGRIISVCRQGSAVPVFGREGTRVGWRDTANGDLCLLEVGGRSVCRVLGEPAPSERGDAGPWSSAFSSDGRLLATASYDGVGLYETREGRELARLQSTNWFGVAFAGTNQVYAAGPHGLTRWPLTWNGPGEVTVGEPQSLTNDYLWQVAASDDGGVVVATGIHEFTLRFADGRVRHLPHQSHVRGAVLSHDGRWLAAAHPLDGLQVWEVGQGTLLGRFPSKGNAAAFDPQGGRVAVCDPDAIVVWDLASRQAVWRSTVPGTIGGLAWSPDGRLIAATRSGVLCLLLEAATGTVLGRLGHPQARPYTAVGFSPDSAQLACSSTAHVVHLWNFRPLRRELAERNLDWDQPPLSPEPPVVPAPHLRLTSSAARFAWLPSAGAH